MERDIEQIIMAQLLNGKCLNDIDLFSENDFSHYGPLFKAVKAEGIDDKIALCRKSGTPIAEMSEILSAYSPALYDNAVNTFSQDKGKEWLRNNLDKPSEEIIEHLSRYVNRKVSAPEPSPDLVMNMLDELDRRAKEKPISVGLSDLDYYLCGVRTSETTYIGARPSVGKSSFAFQCAVNVARQSKKVIFLALEMSENSVVLRHFLSKVSLSNYQVRNGIAKDSWRTYGSEITNAIESLDGFYQNGNFILFGREGKNERDPADLKVIRELIRIHRPFLVVIDQLEQVKESGMHFTDKRARFSHVTHSLQEIALQENVAIWCACQVNRDADNRPPSLANLKESGTIEEDATNVILLHRESDKTEEKQLMQCEIAKQKDGKCGVISLEFDAPRFTFHCTA